MSLIPGKLPPAAGTRLPFSSAPVSEVIDGSEVSVQVKANTGTRGCVAWRGPRKGGGEEASGVGSGSLTAKGGLDWALQLGIPENSGK